MTTAEERMKILSLIQEGKISAEEGTRLLQALQNQAKRQTQTDGQDARWMRVKVTDLKTGASKVSINIPMSLVNVGIKMGARFTSSGANFDYPGVMEALRNRTIGKIADIEDNTKSERVEIWLE